MLESIAKFNDVIGTDDNLKDFRKAGGKMITYHGLSDQLIPPRGTYHYYNSVLQGNYKETQKYYRFFPYPGNGHCGGGAAPLIDGEKPVLGAGELGRARHRARLCRGNADYPCCSHPQDLHVSERAGL